MSKNQTDTKNHWLSDLLSERIASKLGNLPEFNKPNKGAIAIIGINPTNNTKFNIELIKTGSEFFGYNDDQDHPEYKYANISYDNRSYEYLRDQARIWSDHGCDVIVIPENDLTKEQIISIEQEVRGQSKIVFLKADETYSDLAKRTHQTHNNIITKLRPNIFDNSNYIKNLEVLSQDYHETQLRIQHRNDNDGGYPKFNSIIKQNPHTIGILGGAGPMASAEYSRYLSGLGIPHIHYGNSSSASKNNFTKEIGHSFLPAYKLTMLLLKNIGCSHIAMPCNTAHLFLDEFKNFKLLKGIKFIDIKESVVEFIKKEHYQQKRFILFGTDATIGMNVDGTIGDGLYDKIFQENGLEIIKPDRDQQKMIVEAIFLAKSGKMDDARSIITDVFNKMRDKFGLNVGLALVCTDLPIVFGANQLNQLGAVSSIEALASYTSRVLQKDNANPLKRKMEEEEKDNDGDLVRIVSSSLSESDTKNIDCVLENYDLSFHLDNRNKLRIFFTDKYVVSGDKNVDMQIFVKEFSDKNDQLISNIHSNKSYITFTGQKTTIESMIKHLCDNGIKQIKQIIRER